MCSFFGLLGMLGIFHLVCQRELLGGRASSFCRSMFYVCRLDVLSWRPSCLRTFGSGGLRLDFVALLLLCPARLPISNYLYTKETRVVVVFFGFGAPPSSRGVGPPTKKKETYLYKNIYRKTSLKANREDWGVVP